MAVQIDRCDPGNPSAVIEFIDFPFQLYRDYPLWVPRMRSEMEQSLDPARHPFYQSGDAAFFLARRDGRTVGRITAFNNHRYNRLNNSRTGFFFFFESTDDPEVAHGLLDSACAWIRSQGLDRIIGPKGLLPGDSAGLLIEGFEHRPAMGVPYNPPYYPPLLESYGFQKLTDYLSGYLTEEYRLPDRIHRIVERIVERRDYQVKRFASKDELRRWIPRIQQVYNQSFQQAFPGPIGFCPMTEEEIELIADRLLSLARPELIKLLLQGEELIGFLLAYPNIGPGMRRAQGRMWPLGWFHLLREMRTTRWLDINGIGVLPEHQGRGANAVLYAELEATVRTTDFEHAEVVQIREENLKSMGDMKALKVRWHKRHRLYGLDLTSRDERTW